MRDLLQQKLEAVVASTAMAFGCKASVRYDRRYPVLVNTTKWTEFCADVARKVTGDNRVSMGIPATMGAEDFAFMLQEVPGCYLWIGNGPTTGDRILHNTHYDFNDDALQFGIEYWIALAEAASSV